MDPDQALRDLRNAIEDSQTRDYGCAAWCRAAETAIDLAASLDTWLSGKGVPPADWRSTSNDGQAPTDSASV